MEKISAAWPVKHRQEFISATLAAAWLPMLNKEDIKGARGVVGVYRDVLDAIRSGEQHG